MYEEKTLKDLMGFKKNKLDKGWVFIQFRTENRDFVLEEKVFWILEVVTVDRCE